MPTYTYKCENGHEYKEVRSMTEDQQRDTCPEAGCDTKLKRIYDTNPIQFKGTGWANKGGPF